MIQAAQQKHFLYTILSIYSCSWCPLVAHLESHCPDWLVEQCERRRRRRKKKNRRSERAGGALSSRLGESLSDQRARELGAFESVVIIVSNWWIAKQK